MSNCRKTELPAIEIEHHQIREVLRCLLHTIIFNRALGPVKPQEVDSELFDVTYVRCGDPTVDAKVEEKISQYCAWIDRHPGKRGQVSLVFYESRRRQGSWLGIPQEERLYWEQWCINTSIVPQSVSIHEQSALPSAGRGVRQAKLQAAVEEALTVIVRSVNEHKDHIPPVTSSQTLTFPFDITISGEGSMMFGLDAFRRMIMHTSPPPVLRLEPSVSPAQQQGEEQGAIPAGIFRSQQVSSAARGVGMKFIAALCSGDNGSSQSHDPATNGRAAAGARSGLAAAQQMLSDKLREDSGRVIEYEYQRQRSPGRAGSCRAAELPENEGRNRYPDVLPYDDTRVRLKQGTNSYINASLLSSRDAESPSWQFIVAQGPLERTAEHMWQMAWEQQCSMLVMLTRCTENRVTKCAPYFPESAGASSTHGRFTVRTVAAQELDADIRVRELVLTCADEPEAARSIQHYHYHAWPDHAVPRHTTSLRRLAQLLDPQALRPGSEFCAPPLIHCSAGIGRSGALCTVAVAVKRLRAVDPRDAAAARQAVNVKRIVSALRRQRAGMVQTYEQYLLCYQAIKEELDEMLGSNTSSSSSLRRQSQRG